MLRPPKYLKWTVPELDNYLTTGTLQFHEIQRPEVWSRNSQSRLIYSLIAHYPIPSLCVSESKEENGEATRYTVIDGKQRCTAIHHFLHDEFTLEGIPTVNHPESGEPVDFNGKKFGQLDNWVQDVIRNAKLDIQCYEDVPDDDIRQIFYGLNQHPPRRRLKTPPS